MQRCKYAIFVIEQLFCYYGNLHGRFRESQINTVGNTLLVFCTTAKSISYREAHGIVDTLA